MRERAIGNAARAYSAAYGDPLAHGLTDGASQSRRWRLGRSGTVAAVAGVGVVLLVVLAVVGLRAEEVLRPVATLSDGTAPAAPTTGDGVDRADSTSMPEEPEATTATPGRVVHVVGAVKKPGVYTLPAEARLADAVEAAGGATKKADLGSVNLARVVEDGEQIRVPAKGEEPTGAESSPAGGEPDSGADGLVDLNAADAAALDALPGIGPVLAGRIVEWRETNGRFTDVAELAEVSGIGPSLLARLGDLVRV